MGNEDAMKMPRQDPQMSQDWVTRQVHECPWTPERWTQLGGVFRSIEELNSKLGELLNTVDLHTLVLQVKMLETQVDELKKMLDDRPIWTWKRLIIAGGAGGMVMGLAMGVVDSAWIQVVLKAIIGTL